MENKKYINIPLSILLLVSILTYIFFASCIVVNADVPTTQIVVGHSSSWSGYGFTYSLGGKYYTLEDGTGIPISSATNPKFFYTEDNIKFDVIDGLELFTFVLNNNAGIIAKDAILNTLYNSFLTAISIGDSSNYKQGGLYSNGTFLGYCLNDISGCYYAENSTDGFSIPDYYQNDVYNFYNYQSGTTDYFTFYPEENSVIFNNWYDSVPISATNIANKAPNYDNFAQLWFAGSQYNTTTIGGSRGGDCSFFDNCYLVLNYNPNNDYWTDFCRDVGLRSGRTILNQRDIVSTRKYIPVKLYENSTHDVVTTVITYDGRNDTLSSNNSTTFYIGYNGYLLSLGGEPITVYKTNTIADDISNNTYEPNEFTTNTYNTFDTNNTTDFSTTKNAVNESTLNNSSIYQDASQNFYENIDNSVINTENITNNITNITNNYYGSGGGDNPNNPDNPDNPDNPEDNTTLEAILQAILRFFNAIGNIIGTVLAGILNMIDAVLEAIAGITEDLTGISDFFAAMLGWLPEPIPTVIGIGISLCIIAGIVKFIRG